MMLLSVHIAFAGIWLGCVLTEALFERALLGSGRDSHLLLARLHKKVDIFIEIPAILGVLVSGAVMLVNAPLSGAFYIKIAFAAAAVIANVICVRLVFSRLRAAEVSDWEQFDRLDHLQHRIGALVLLGLLGALVVGMAGK